MTTPAAARPAPFSVSTTPAFWDDPHISARMLALHLDPDAAPASRPHAVIDRSVAWLTDALALAPGDRVLDLGCGPGLYAWRLARRGVHVVGIDASRRSVAHARATAEAEHLTARFRHGDYLRDDLGTGYDAALLVYEDLCALSPVQRGLLLGRVRVALWPGGVLAMDVTAAARFAVEHPGRWTGDDLMDGFWAPSPYRGTHERWTYPDLRLVLDRYTVDTGTDVRQFWNWLHCLTPAQVAEELAGAGLGAPEVHGDLTGSRYDPASPTFAVLSRRPA